MNYFSGVDHGTLDHGALLLRSNRLSPAMDSQSRIKGITCCCYFFIVFFLCNYFYFIFFLVISCSDIQKGPIKLLNVDIELSLMTYAVVPIGHWLFCTCYILECVFRFRDQRFL